MLTFAPGVSTRPISVIVNGDTTVEPNETFSVALSGATNAVLRHGDWHRHDHERRYGASADGDRIGDIRQPRERSHGHGGQWDRLCE